MTRKNNLSTKKRLDRAGSHFVIASVLSEEDASRLAESPFLFARVRARIASQHDSKVVGGIWRGFWLISRRAIPAMSLAAVLSSGLFLYTEGNESANSTFSVDAYLGTGESGIESMVFAERPPLTDEEVLATIVANDEREPAQ